VYGFPDCKDEYPSASPLTSSYDPWYGFGCWSGAEGDWGALPYSVASFSVGPGSDEGKCWVFAKESGATSLLLEQYAWLLNCMVGSSVGDGVGALPQYFVECSASARGNRDVSPSSARTLVTDGFSAHVAVIAQATFLTRQ